MISLPLGLAWDGLLTSGLLPSAKSTNHFLVSLEICHKDVQQFYWSNVYYYFCFYFFVKILLENFLLLARTVHFCHISGIRLCWVSVSTLVHMLVLHTWAIVPCSFPGIGGELPPIMLAVYIVVSSCALTATSFLVIYFIRLKKDMITLSTTTLVVVLIGFLMLAC